MCPWFTTGINLNTNFNLKYVSNYTDSTIIGDEIKVLNILMVGIDIGESSYYWL